MKKLVVLLASAMMFAFSANAFAFTDMDDQSKVVTDAVSKAVALEIVEGYEDDTFRPDSTITRAEFAKIAVTAAGAANTATMLEDTSSEFSDVISNAWYTGWINAASSLGLVQGDGDGTFRPNETISNAEVVSVVLRLLGYNDNLTGTWPTNYITQANKLDVLDDVTISSSAAATRADVAVILDAILGEDMVKYSKDTETFEYQTNTSEETYTLLYDSFSGHITEDTPLSEATLKDAEEFTFKVNGMEAAATVVIGGDATLLSLEGHLADTIYDVDSDGDYYIKYVDVTSYTVVTDDVDLIDGDEMEVDGKDYDVIYDYMTEAEMNAVIGGGTSGDDYNKYYTVFFNDDDEVYAISSDTISDYATSTVASFIEEIDGDEITTLNDLVDGDEVFEYDADDHVIIDAATGEFITPDDLEEGMVLANYYGNDNILIAYEATTGDFTLMTSASKYTLDGSAYHTGGNADIYDEDMESLGYGDTYAADYLGEEVTFFVNADNTVTEIITGDGGDSSKLYGVVVDISTSSNSWTETSSINDITIFTEDGKTVTYELTSDGEDDYDDYVNTAGAELYNGTSPVPSAYGAVVEYKLNDDGEIKSMDAVDKTAASDSGDYSYTVSSDKYVKVGSTYTLASDVVIFDISEDDGEIEVSLATRASVLAADSLDSENVYFSDFDGTGDDKNAYLAAGVYIAKTTSSTINVMAVVGLNGTSSNEFAVVSSINFSNSDYTDGEATIKLNGDVYEYTYATGVSGAAADDIIEYTVSGDEVTILKVYKTADIASNKVKAVDDGLVTYYETSAEDSDDIDNFTMGDDTLVFVMDSDGDFTLGSQDDVKAKAYVDVLVTTMYDTTYDYEADEDGYVYAVVVDEDATNYAFANEVDLTDYKAELTALANKDGAQSLGTSESITSDHILAATAGDVIIELSYTLNNFKNLVKAATTEADLDDLAAKVTVVTDEMIADAKAELVAAQEAATVSIDAASASATAASVDDSDLNTSLLKAKLVIVLSTATIADVTAVKDAADALAWAIIIDSTSYSDALDALDDANDACLD